MSRVHWHVAYIGIGSNLDSPVEQVSKAIEQLRELPNSRLIAVSGLYRSAPQCGRDQPDYINAVAMLETRLMPDALLDLLVRRQSLSATRTLSAVDTALGTWPGN